VVITSVNRDDLDDGGSRHFAETVREVRRALPDARVEVLTPDFRGDLEAVARVLDAGPHVFNHNMETVPRLYRRVRPQADYRQSLGVLAFAKRMADGRRAAGESAIMRSGWPLGQDEGVRPVVTCSDEGDGQTDDKSRSSAERTCRVPLITKSGFMVGLGETEEEVRALLRDLRAAGTDVATIGQYLQPTRRNLAVAAFVEPRQFDAYRDYGLSLGFKAVFSGPLVRSSYMADEVSEEARRALC
jgi:lipoic acid synthetase